MSRVYCADKAEEEEEEKEAECGLRAEEYKVGAQDFKTKHHFYDRN